MIFAGFKYFYILLENEESSQEVSQDTNTLRVSLEVRHKH